MTTELPASTSTSLWLPDFNTADLTEVARVFEKHPGLSLKQAWLAQPETNLTPATVWTGWRNKTFFVFAQLDDVDIYSEAEKPNERLWELGDSFEIFLRPNNQIAYSELQVSPNNQRLQLRFADAAAVEWARSNDSIQKATVSDIAFKSWTWVHAESRRWHVLAEIPVAAICDTPADLPGAIWRCSFCRYDYTHGRLEPVISSTSPLTHPNFHRQNEWGSLQFL